jgi:hypothetical protein
MGELRFYRGPCDCGLKALPREPPVVAVYSMFLQRVIESLEALAENLSRLSP